MIKSGEEGLNWSDYLCLYLIACGVGMNAIFVILFITRYT